MDENENRVPRIMLSGFDAEAEKKYMINIIDSLKGVYLSDTANPQAYNHSCTHIICKKPNRCEKYLAGCASGKWVLTPYFLHESKMKKQWLPEKDYEWGASISSVHPKDLQTAPKRWREKINIKHLDRPFLGWTVGLVMDVSFSQAYTRIIEAGGGCAEDISSRYESDSQLKTNPTNGLLTHVLVTPKLACKISRSRTEDVPYLRAEYLAMYILNDPPPKLENFLLFPEEDSDSISKQKPGAEQDKNKTHPPSTRVVSGQKSSADSSNTTLASNVPAVQSQRPDKTIPESRSEERRFSQESSERKTVESPRKSGFVSPNRGSPTPLHDAKTRWTFAHPIQKTTEMSSKSTSISNIVVKSPVIRLGPGLNIHKPVRSPISSSTPDRPAYNQRSLFNVFGPIQVSPSPIVPTKEPALQLRDVKNSLPKLSPAVQQSSSKTKARPHVPTISLGTKRISELQPTTSKRQGDGTGSKSKRFCSEEFLTENYAVFQEFSIRKKRQHSFYGVFEEVSNEDMNCEDSSSFNNRNAKPFSREVMMSLEASLEVNYRYSYFLKEVSSRMTRGIYPPPEVIYVIMKPILLESEDQRLSSIAFDILLRILQLHSPQANDIRNEKVYHRAFALMTTQDADETSTIMVTIGEMLSRSNNADWMLWCSRDPSLGTHWTFFSRVFNIAIQPANPTFGQNGVKNESYSAQKVHNATLLSIFLTKLVIKDYQDVLTKNEYSSNSPIIKCMIADLLWPTMTGLEPWFRRPSPNLADLVLLFVKSAESHLSHLNAEVCEDEEDFGGGDDGNADFEINDPCEGSSIVFEHMCKLITVTASWCIHCDVRDKERGKRTGSRSFESDLVSTLRFELEERKFEVLELILQNIPPRLRIKVNIALIQEICSDVLVADTVKTDSELSLELITSRHMQMMPAVLQGEERDSSNQNEDDNNDNNIIKKDPSPTTISTTDEDPVQEFEDILTNPDVVNKRNRKGETALHIACMNNRPNVVEDLLKNTGVDPNVADYAGWTPLGEACNHGHIDCVRALLQLPIKDRNQAEGKSEPSLSIDVTLCPTEGQTPLHDALGNGHVDIACLLLQKGGVQLLDKADSEGRTPLDYCVSDTARSYMIEYACKVAQENTQGINKKKNERGNNGTKIMKLSPKENYEKVLPRPSVLTSEVWRDRITWYFKVTCLLLSHYVASGGYVQACLKIGADSENDSPTRAAKYPKIPDDDDDVIVIDDDNAHQPEDRITSHRSHTQVSRKDIHRYANDVSICLRWKECWMLFRKHIKRLLANDNETTNEVFSDVINPVPIDLLPDISTGYTG